MKRRSDGVMESWSVGTIQSTALPRLILWELWAMNKNVFRLALCAMLFALCSSVEAQQPAKIPRIGFLSELRPNGSNVAAFRQGLRELGYIEGKNILIEFRNIKGNQDRTGSDVNELVQLKVDVLVSPLQSAIRAAKQATKTIPIVMVVTSDPVATGLVEKLARPGGNITGVTRLTSELSGKRLELLKETIPTLSRVEVLLMADSPNSPIAFKEYEAAARALKIPLQSLVLRRPEPDFDGAFQAAVGRHTSAIIAPTFPLFIRYQKRMIDLAIKNRLPSMHEQIDFVEAGGLMSYSANDTDSFKRAATYVDKILKGAKPADLPVERPTKFEFVINLKTAKQIGLTIPSNVLASADRVIK
jgi:putative ABC transport system substrate-binding protein